MLFTNNVRGELLRLAKTRGPGKSFCPSEVARALWPDDWRGHMNQVREEASKLIAAGELICTQGGAVVDIDTAKGPIRLSTKV